jgi:hypothetical protein
MNLEAATRQYVDSTLAGQLPGKVNRSGDTMTYTLTALFTWVPFSCSTDTAIAVSKVSIMPTGITGSTANISVEIMGEAPIHVCTVNS